MSAATDRRSAGPRHAPLGGLAADRPGPVLELEDVTKTYPGHRR